MANMATNREICECRILTTMLVPHLAIGDQVTRTYCDIYGIKLDDK